MTDDYLISEKPFPVLCAFAAPIIIGNLFQQFYTMVDSVIVGRYVGEQALAAVGASYALTAVFICVAMGGGIGAAVVVSRYFGAGDYGRMKTAISTALIAFVGISVVLAVAGHVSNKAVLALLHTPENVLDQAGVYLDIYFFGLPFLFMYNILSSLFNALGKSRYPLFFLIFSSLLNGLLDVLFVTKLHAGVAGVAWATLLAQGISAVLSCAVFFVVMRAYKCGSYVRFRSKELVNMMHIAVPSVLQQAAVSIGMLLVQSVVNGFGAEVLAGYAAAARVESIAVVPMASLSTALSSYTSQNIGAKKLERVFQGYHAANILVAAFAIASCVFLTLYHDRMMRLFLGTGGSALARSIGSRDMQFKGWFYGIMGAKMAVDGLLRGAGDMKFFTIANMVNLLIRVMLSMLLAPVVGVCMVWYAVPIGWLANFTISYTAYRSGKWKRSLLIQ